MVQKTRKYPPYKDIIYNNVKVSKGDKLVKTTIYIPFSAKESLRKARVSISHLARSAVLRYLKSKVQQRERQRFRYYNDENFKNGRLENARKQKKKL